MKHNPPRIAPGADRSRHAHRIASCVEAGPGSRFVTAMASSNSDAGPSTPARSTQSRRNRAIWVGGPPKPMHADAAPLPDDRAQRHLATRRTDQSLSSTCRDTGTPPSAVRRLPVGPARSRIVTPVRSLNPRVALAVGMLAVAPVLALSSSGRRGPLIAASMRPLPSPLYGVTVDNVSN